MAANASASNGYEKATDLIDCPSLQVVDGIFQGFLATHPLPDLLIQKENYNNKTLIHYTHNSATRTGTISTVCIGYPGADSYDQQRVKITLKGVPYTEIESRHVVQNVETRKLSNWLMLSPDYLESQKDNLPTACLISKQHNAGLSFLYNLEHKRVQVEFREPDHLEPFLVFTLKHGRHVHKKLQRRLRGGCRDSAPML